MRTLGASLKADDPTVMAHSFAVDGKIIPIVFDVPHLVKSVRNNLKRHGLKIQDKNISWSHLETFYENDKKNTVRLAPKLTEKHIILPPFMNMRVRLATQVFSHTVAAGMKTMVDLGRLPSEALDTALFFQDMNRLFDILNSRTIGDKNPWRRPLNMRSAVQVKVLEESLPWISSWSFRPRFIPPCQWGFSLTIRSVILLWNSMANINLKFICTAKLNQDCIEVSLHMRCWRLIQTGHHLSIWATWIPHAQTQHALQGEVSGSS
ncbi:hypothetical protein AALO_G00133450 [Alosa alosa]|uniref:Transposable element P transposase-like GTP-binding insertion domain-containing protein n=1 Tax=Alosa alosa TaxID=278164 RepID=A0AAV6GG68_9TELE|nr:hypothetical protein AALO_G00133450 [Alosa alosa]